MRTADAQADLSLHWAHTHFVGFVMRRLILQRCVKYLILQRSVKTQAQIHTSFSVLLELCCRNLTSREHPYRSNPMFAPRKWTASSEFGTYRLCEQRRFRRACASAQSRQNLRCSLIQAVNQEELSDRKPDPWPL